MLHPPQFQRVHPWADTAPAAPSSASVASHSVALCSDSNFLWIVCLSVSQHSGLGKLIPVLKLLCIGLYDAADVGVTMLADSPVFTFEEAKEPLLRSWQVCCFTINVIMGSGFLGVPAGFTQAGLALGPAILLLVSLLQWAAACQIVQTASRAHALLLARSAETTLTPTLAPFAASLLKNEHGSPGARGQSEDVRPPSLTLPSHTSYEIMMLCRLHLGPVRRRLRATRDAAPSQRPRPLLYPLAHD